MLLFHCWIACGRKTKDALPPKMTSYCKKQNSCARLARQGKCRKKFKQSIYRYCKRKLPHVQLNAYVKNYCRKSCKNCVGTFIIRKPTSPYFSISIIRYYELFVSKNITSPYYSFSGGANKKYTTDPQWRNWIECRRYTYGSKWR